MVKSNFFSADLIEVAIARHYEHELGASVVSVGSAPKWDIQFSDKTTVEVKVDAMAAKTLNAAIEYWDLRRNKPTGILESEAEIWLHCVPEGEGLRCYEINTKRLLRLCVETGEVKTGGDYDSSVLKLVPLQEIKKISNTDFVLNGKLVDFARYW